MVYDRISALEREIVKLRAEVADVRAAIKADSDDTTKHIVSLNKGLGLANDWLTSLIYRVMPEHAEAREQLDGILGVKRPPTKQGTSS